MIKDEDTAYEQARQERIDSPLLSDRLRPGVECAPWVIEEVRKLERERDAALQHEAEMANSVMLTGQVAFQAQEAAKDLAKQLDAANELIRAYREVCK
jgi:hypothetical protein